MTNISTEEALRMLVESYDPTGCEGCGVVDESVFEAARSALERAPLTEEQAAKLEKLKAKLGDEDLDEMIHEMYANTAAATNNRGIDGQLEFLVEEWGAKVAIEMIESVIR